MADRDTSNYWTPDFDDRRRLAAAELLMRLEFNEFKGISQMVYGRTILNYVTTVDEVPEMAPAATRSVYRTLGMI